MIESISCNNNGKNVIKYYTPPPTNLGEWDKTVIATSLFMMCLILNQTSFVSQTYNQSQHRSLLVSQENHAFYNAMPVYFSLVPSPCARLVRGWGLRTNLIQISQWPMAVHCTCTCDSEGSSGASPS